MIRRISSLSLASVFTVSVLLLAGCAPQDEPAGGDEAAKPVAESDYNPHDVPITEEQKEQLRQDTAEFSQAVAKIKWLRVETERETKDGIPESPYKAHQALDQVDLVLQWLPETASTSNIPKDRWEEVTTAANDLRGLFEKVHQNIDNKQNPDFAAVAAKIDERINLLEAIGRAPRAAPAGSAPVNQ